MYFYELHFAPFFLFSHWGLNTFSKSLMPRGKAYEFYMIFGYNDENKRKPMINRIVSYIISMNLID